MGLFGKHRLVHTRSCKAFAELPPCRWPSRRLLPTIRPASGGHGTARQLDVKRPYRRCAGSHAEILSLLPLPTYLRENRIHSRLAKLSERCHIAAGEGALNEVKVLEAEVDEATAKLWGISDKELRTAQQALAKPEKRKQNARLQS